MDKFTGLSHVNRPERHHDLILSVLNNCLHLSQVVAVGYCVWISLLDLVM